MRRPRHLATGACLVGLLLALHAVAPTSPPATMSQLVADLRAAQALQDSGDHREAALAFDRCLLEATPHSASSSSSSPALPLHVRVGALISSGRSHFADANLNAAYTRFSDAKRVAPPSHPDVASGTVDQVLSQISAKLGLSALIVAAHFEAWARASPTSAEARYDYAMWRIKVAERATVSEENRLNTGEALRGLYEARDLLMDAGAPAHQLHRGIRRPHYLWGLILHEIGRLERRLHADELAARAAFDLGVRIGLWTDARRRYVRPLPHPKWPSVPVITRDVKGTNLDAAPLFPSETVRLLQENFDTIRREVVALERRRSQAEDNLFGEIDIADSSWSDEGESLHSRPGLWRMIRFTRDGSWDAETCTTLMPQTCAVLRRVPDLAACMAESCTELFVFMSRLSRGTNILPHCGPTWKRVRIHLVVEAGSAAASRDDGRGGAALRIGGQELEWAKNGDVVVFDDSFEHEVVWRDKEGGWEGNKARRAEKDRIVLVVDVFHPRYTAWIRSSGSATGLPLERAGEKEL